LVWFSVLMLKNGLVAIRILDGCRNKSTVKPIPLTPLKKARVYAQVCPERFSIRGKSFKAF
jgi:hypothetical protein